jgi:hypothetical protein
MPARQEPPMVIRSRLIEWARIEDRLAVRRTIVLAVTVWMTWRAFAWAAEYAEANAATSGVDTAAIIAAVTAPITYLQVAVFNAYINAKKGRS